MSASASGEVADGCAGSWQQPKNNLYPDRGQCRCCLDWFPRLSERGGQLGFHRAAIGRSGESHPYDPDKAVVLAAREALDLPRLESVKYLLDVFIEGGYAEDDDVQHIDAVYGWLVDCGQFGSQASPDQGGEG